MNQTCRRALSMVSFALLIATVPLRADAIFNFNNVTAGTRAPFTSTVDGLSATVSGAASVCDVTTAHFSSLTGNALIQDLCNPPQNGSIGIAFSSNLSKMSFNFATAFSPSGTLTIKTFENSTLLGTSVFSSAVPPGNFPNGEGIASISGLFNNILLTPSSILAVDNINAAVAASAVPEPGSLWTLLGGLVIFAVCARRSFALR